MSKRKVVTWIPRVVVGVIGAVLFVTAGGATLGWTGLWAWRFLLYIPLSLRVLMSLILLAAALGPIWLTPDAQPWTPPRLSWPWLTPLLAGCAALFWLLRSHTLHGDGLFKTLLHRTATLQTDPYVWKEPLDSLFAYGLSGLFRAWGWPAELAIALWSVLSGLLAVAAVLYMAQGLARSRQEWWLWLIALFSLGSSLLWFGHIENYSLVTASALAAIALALGYIEGRNPLWPVGLLAGVAAAFHPQAGFTLPALAALLAWGNWRRWQSQCLTLGITGAAGPLLTVAAMLALRVPLPGQGGSGIPGGELQLFWTLGQALAPHRLADAFNNLGLVAPLWPFLLVGGGMALLGDRSILRDRRFLYLSLTGLGLLVYHFTFQNELPRYQDWDLFAIVGPPVTLWGLYIWTRPRPWLLPWLLQTGLLLALLYTGAWIGVNASYTLVNPDPAHQDRFAYYRRLDLAQDLTDTQIESLDPACVGCASLLAIRGKAGADGESFLALEMTVPARATFILPPSPDPAFLWTTPRLTWAQDAPNPGPVQTQIWQVSPEGVETLLWEAVLTPPGNASTTETTVLAQLQMFSHAPTQLRLQAMGSTPDAVEGLRVIWDAPWILTGTLYQPQTVESKFRKKD